MNKECRNVGITLYYKYMKKQTSLFPHHQSIVTIAALAAIVAGAVFVINYPKAAWRYELDTKRMMEAQDLEQAMEWYMIRQTIERTNITPPANS